MNRHRGTKRTTGENSNIQQRGNGNIGVANHNGIGDNVAGSQTVSRTRPSPFTPSPMDDAEQPPVTARRASRRPLAAAVSAVLSAVVSALINLLTTSWSWWIFAIAAALLFTVAGIAYVRESVAHG